MDDFQNETQDDDINDIEVDNSDSSTENENVETDTDETEQEQGGDQSHESSQEDQVTFDEKQQAKVNQIVGEKVAKTYEERRRADELERELSEIKKRVPEPTAPEIPPLPNVNDFYGDPEGYNRKLVERDAAIQKRAEFDAQQRYLQDQQQQQVQRAEFEKAQKQQASIQSYAENAKSFGIDAGQMQKDAQTVLQVGITTELSDHIVSDPQGALITNYLAKNLVELDTIARMSPMSAAIYIANEVKPKLKGVKKSSSAPEPTKIVGGGGAPEKVPSAIAGAKFE